MPEAKKKREAMVRPPKDLSEEELIRKKGWCFDEPDSAGALVFDHGQRCLTMVNAL